MQRRINALEKSHIFVAEEVGICFKFLMRRDCSAKLTGISIIQLLRILLL